MSHPAVLAALADPTRWQVLNLLAERGEGTATALSAALPVSRAAVIKHLTVLDRAGLVEHAKAGREVRYRVRPDRLESTAQWLAELASTWNTRLATLKRLVEAAPEPSSTA